MKPILQHRFFKQCCYEQLCSTVFGNYFILHRPNAVDRLIVKLEIVDILWHEPDRRYTYHDSIRSWPSCSVPFLHVHERLDNASYPIFMVMP